MLGFLSSGAATNCWVQAKAEAEEAADVHPILALTWSEDKAAGHT